jgi:hypothetical protein
MKPRGLDSPTIKQQQEKQKKSKEEKERKET